MTLTDEVGRKQKIYSDTLGRTAKTEVLMQVGQTYSVYSTVKNTYNLRDQVTQIRQYQGSETSGGAFQDTVMTYDGHGRLWTRKAPIEDSPGTTYLYNADDTVQRRIDARGAYQTFAYNAPLLITGIDYAKP